MRYWRLKETDRVIAVDKTCEMSNRWLEISKELYDEFKLYEEIKNANSNS
jgi:hypothetical protein